MIKSLVFTLATSMLLSVAHAKTEKLVSQLTKGEKGVIQRGYSYDQAMCASEEIEFLTSAGSANTVRVTFDDDEGGDIVFKFKDGFVRICGETSMTEISEMDRIVIDY